MIKILTGDCLDVLPTLETGSVQCCVTSPPYWGLRDYGTATWEGGDAECDHKFDHSKREAKAINFVNGHGKLGQGCRSWTTRAESEFNRDCPKCGARRIDSQLGLESTPQEYVAKMVRVFREVWRVLRDDGTLWLNMGDSYAGGLGGRGDSDREIPRADGTTGKPSQKHSGERIKRELCGLKPKDLCGIPWRLAFALQADGWYLRSDIIWSKLNPMPESVTDRPTKSHEYIFLLTKNGGNPLIWRARDTGEWSYNPDLSEIVQPKGYHDAPAGWAVGDVPHNGIDGNYKHPRKVDPKDEPIPRWKGFDYYYDADAIREPNETGNRPDKWEGRQYNGKGPSPEHPGKRNGNVEAYNLNSAGRNKRTVWTVATQPYAEAHFATFPEALIQPCIMAGSRIGDIVLDPFAGSGTTGRVAIELGRKAVLIELNPQYVEMINKRVDVTPGML